MNRFTNIALSLVSSLSMAANEHERCQQSLNVSSADKFHEKSRSEPWHNIQGFVFDVDSGRYKPQKVSPADAHQAAPVITLRPTTTQTFEVRTTNARGQELIGHVLLISEKWPEKATNLPKLHVFVGGGPGLSGKTLKPIYDGINNDRAILLPPGSLYKTDKKLRHYTDMSHIREPYASTIQWMHAAIAAVKRAPEQLVITHGHSHGGIMAADTVIMSLQAKNDLRVSGMVMYAAPLTKESFDATVHARKDARLTQYPILFGSYTASAAHKNPKTVGQLFKMTVISYNELDLLTSHDSPAREEVHRAILEDAVQPHNFLQATRRFRHGNKEIVLALNQAISNQDPDMLIPTGIAFSGKDDRLLSPETSHLDYRDAGIEHVVIKNAAHFPQFEAPQEIISILNEIDEFRPVQAIVPKKVTEGDR